MRVVFPKETYPEQVIMGDTGGSDSFVAPVFYSDDQYASMMDAKTPKQAAEAGMSQFYNPDMETISGFKESRDYMDAVADINNFVTDLVYKGYKPGEVDIRRPETLTANQMLNQKIQKAKALEQRLKSMKRVYDDQLIKDKLTKQMPIDPATGLPIMGESNELFTTDFVPENTIAEASNRAFGGRQFYGGEYGQARREVEANRQAIEEQKRTLVAQGYDPQAVERAFSERLQAPINQVVMPTARQVYPNPNPSGVQKPEIVAAMEAQEPKAVFTGHYPTRNGKVLPYTFTTKYHIPVGGSSPVTTNLMNFVAMSGGKGGKYDTPVSTGNREVSFSDIAIVPVLFDKNGKFKRAIPDKDVAKLRGEGHNAGYIPVAVGSFKEKSGIGGVTQVKDVQGYVPLADVLADGFNPFIKGGTKAERTIMNSKLESMFDIANSLNGQLGQAQPQAQSQPKNKPLDKMSNQELYDNLLR
jgi:hypothetical protein